MGRTGALRSKLISLPPPLPLYLVYLSVSSLVLIVRHTFFCNLQPPFTLQLLSNQQPTEAEMVERMNGVQINGVLLYVHISIALSLSERFNSDIQI